MIIFTPTVQESESLGEYGRNAIETGMGKLAMVHALYHHKDSLFNNEAVLVGFCGLLKGQARVGDKVIPSVYVDGDYNGYPLENPAVHFIEIKRGATIACISQDRILTNNPYKDICESFKTVITDMESYAFVEFCRMYGIKYKVMRVVSDIVGKDSAKDFNQACLNGVLGKALAKELK